jgi:hypothetical protein
MAFLRVTVGSWSFSNHLVFVIHVHLSFQATQVSTILKSPNKILPVRGPESSSDEFSTSSLPKPDSSLSDYAYVGVTTNERYAISLLRDLYLPM